MRDVITAEKMRGNLVNMFVFRVFLVVLMSVAVFPSDALCVSDEELSIHIADEMRADAKIVFDKINATHVVDENYFDVVDVKGSTGSTIIIFYNEDEDESRGAASLASAIEKYIGGIDIYAYKLTSADMGDKSKMQYVAKTYNVHSFPTFLLLKMSKEGPIGGVVLTGGEVEVDLLAKRFFQFEQYIQKNSVPEEWVQEDTSNGSKVTYHDFRGKQILN